MDENGNYFNITIKALNGFNVHYDNENGELKEFSLKDRSAYEYIELSEVPTFISVTVVDGDFVITVEGYKSEKEIINIAESIITS